MKRRVVITGLGALSPIGNDVPTLWESIENCKCGIDKITKFDTSDFKVKLAGEVKGLDVEQYFDKRRHLKILRLILMQSIRQDSV